MMKIYLTKWSKKRRNGWEGEYMAFIFKAPKRKYIQKSASKDGQEVLDRLNAYLDGNADEPAKFLVNFWKDQGNAFSYKEIREAMLEGTVSEETMRLWQQDYTKMVADKMYPVWLNAITAGAKGQPIFDELPPGFSFNTGVPNVVSWIATRGSRFITAVTEEQRRAVNALLLKRVADKFTVDELARVIRPCIGLTARQTKANVRYYRSIKERLAKEHPRMKRESIERKAREKQLIYAAKQQRERAYTIAHTEMAFAFNKGMDATIRQAQAEGLMGGMEKRWITAGVDNVCSICQALDGTQVGMDEEFGFPGKVLFPGHKLTPPAHPRCRCAVQYVEVEAPKLGEDGILTPDQPASSYGDGEGKNIDHDPPKYLGTLDNMSEDMVLSTLREYEKEIVGYDKESAVVITESGLVFQCFGDKESVHPDDDMGDALKGAYVTHNHPVGSSNEYSFSDFDIQLFTEYELKALRGIDEKYIYELSRDSDDVDSYSTIEELMRSKGELARHQDVIRMVKKLNIGYRRWKR